MKIRITRQATEAEAAAILEDMTLRAKAGEDVRAALAKHITPERIGSLIGELPADAQERIQTQFAPRPIRQSFKLTTRLKKP